MRKAALVAAVLMSFGSLMADPPPHPRYKITNGTPWTISGNFVSWYCPMGSVMTNTPVTLSGTMAPGQSIERQVPHRIPHLCGNASYPCIFVVFKDTVMTINGSEVRHTLKPFGSAPCDYLSGDRALSPGETAKFGGYGSSCVKMTCSGGSGSATAQDYFDCTILP